MVEMNPALTDEKALIDWGVAARPLAGQSVCGDLHLVQPFSNGVLFAAVDGVGHGPEATDAARRAVDFLARHADEPITSLVRCCHEELLRTRGVVLTVASLNARDSTMTWLGVGNVQGRLWRSQPGKLPRTESVLLRGGLVGHQIPTLYGIVVPLRPGDCLLFATDGIALDFDEAINFAQTPQQIADGALQRYFKGTDDALVLVGRWRGGPHE
jgi:hypothetical protein